MATILVSYILHIYFRLKGAKFLNIYDDTLFHYPTTSTKNAGPSSGAV
jgi:hypothetical protein